jgi:class 3 adenylate cyclase
MEGRLDDGGAAVTEKLAHARTYHLRAWEVLSLSQMAAIALGRCEFARFAALIAETPGIFSGPMMEAARAELAGEYRQAQALVPSAEVYADASRQAYRAASLARICCSSGDEAGARRHLAAWQAWYDQIDTSATVARFDAVAEIDACLATLGEEALVRAVYAESAGWAPWRCTFLPAWGFDHIRGALALRLGLLEEAAGHYRTGLAWAERERYPVEQGRCLAGLAEVAAQRGEPGEALALLDRAAGLFQEHGAVPYLSQVLAAKLRLQGVASGLVTTSSIDAVTAAVSKEPPDLRAHAAPDGTVTVMFTDIEDSTRLTEQLGDARWLEVLREHNALVREQIARHGGFEVKHQGDGFMVVFSSAARALRCAIGIQRALAPTPGPSPNAGGGEPLAGQGRQFSPSPSIGGGGQGVGAIRIGLHTGEAVRDADDFFGHHVILAARIADQARGGEILVSGLLKELTESSGAFVFDGGRELQLKGLTGTQRVFGVAWT